MIEAARPLEKAGPLLCQTAGSFDVVIIGGGFAGAASALLLKRALPACRILILERAKAFDRKVGEATVEVSGYFLHQVLGLYGHLSSEHLPKHGLRYWFTDGPNRRLSEMSEVGGRELPLLPAFQLNRSRLDEHLLEKAKAAGVEVKRDVRVTDVTLGWPESQVLFADGGEEQQVASRWVIDASGRQGVIANVTRQRRFFDEMTTAAVWARWKDVVDMDAPDNGLFDADTPSVAPARRLATNHFCGYGWWCWVIPLGGGETSIGLVYDKRLYDPGLNEGGPRAAYRRFVTTQPGLRELLRDATMVEDDFNLRRNLAYTTEAYAGKGWALVGDAASFLDPFYSPGLDHASISIQASTTLIADDLGGRLDQSALDQALFDHNALFERSIRRWLEALYLDKYEIMGDAELMRCSFQVDTALYYLGVVGPVMRDPSALGHPVFGLPLPQTRYASAFMRFFKQRLVKIARYRLKSGRYGRRNVGWRAYGRAFDLRWRSIAILGQGIATWGRMELEYLLHRLGGGVTDVSRPVARTDLPEMPSTAK